MWRICPTFGNGPKSPARGSGWANTVPSAAGCSAASRPGSSTLVAPAFHLATQGKACHRKARRGMARRGKASQGGGVREIHFVARPPAQRCGKLARCDPGSFLGDRVPDLEWSAVGRSLGKSKRPTIEPGLADKCPCAQNTWHGLPCRLPQLVCSVGGLGGAIGAVRAVLRSEAPVMRFHTASRLMFSARAISPSDAPECHAPSMRASCRSL